MLLEKFLYKVFSNSYILTFTGPMRSFIVKENHISSAVSEILQYRQKHRLYASCYFYIRIMPQVIIFESLSTPSPHRHKILNVGKIIKIASNFPQYFFAITLARSCMLLSLAS